MNEREISASDPVPEPIVVRTRKLVIRERNALWVLEDEFEQVGGMFTTFDAAATYARREQLHAPRGIRCVVVFEERRAGPLRAA